MTPFLHNPTETKNTDPTPVRLWFAACMAILLGGALAWAVRASGGDVLVVMPYSDWGELQRQAARPIITLHYRDGQLLALCSRADVSGLRSEGLHVEVVDAHAAFGEYYLLEPSPGALPREGRPQQALYFFKDGTLLLRLTREQLAKMPPGDHGLIALSEPVSLSASRTWPAASPAQGSHASGVLDLVEEVSPTLLLHHVCKLQDDDGLEYCNEGGTRFSYATDGVNEAASYLRGQYEALGLMVWTETFLHGTTVMTNVVAEWAGVGPDAQQVYIVCAHYDSISQDPYVSAPGADDNASGCAGVLEAARVLSQHSFSRTLRFVHFSGEEQFLLGSAEYARLARARGESIVGVINLDMIGFESVPPGDHIVEIHAGEMPESQAIADLLISNVAAYALALSPERITSRSTWRSDHASFWTQGYPAVLCIEDFDDFNPHYHTARDTLAGMQPDLMSEYTRAVVATLANLAGLQVNAGSRRTFLPAVRR